MFGAKIADRGSVRVKICGITNAADAAAAIDAGADALGFNCYPRSRRFVDLGSVEEWACELPDGVAKVAILVNATLAEALRIARLPFVTSLQLHGQETPEFCARIAGAGVRFGKALPATDDVQLNAALAFSTCTVVLDSVEQGSFGGTGRTFSWETAARFIEAYPSLQVVLAGGLTPMNVVEALRVTRPFAVDVTSGVESSPGVKDHQLLRSFVAAAKSA